MRRHSQLDFQAVPYIVLSRLRGAKLATKMKANILSQTPRRVARGCPRFFFFWLLAIHLAAPVMGQGIYATPYTFTTMAGLARYQGTNDGAESTARFNNPTGVAVDGAGNVYVADTENDTIRKVTPSGMATTLAGMAFYAGTNDGTNANARFRTPRSTAVDTNGNVYVADGGNTIRKMTPVGTNWVVTTLAGLGDTSGTNDGTNSDARFYAPMGASVDSATNIYVADYVSHTIRKVTPVGTNWVVTTLAGLGGSHGTNDGTNSDARFFGPTGVAVDTNGNIYVADNVNNTVRKVTPSGTNWVVTTIAGLAGNSGANDGTNGDARFSNPSDVAVDTNGNVFVADTFTNNTIRKLTPIGTNWVVTTLAGLAGTFDTNDGTGSAAQFLLRRA